MTIPQIAGYLLEEVLIYMLRHNGYSPLSQGDDPDALVTGGNGLSVRGRGANHQADALGDLNVSIPFSLPIRLFVEAKCVASVTGLNVIRNAHGVVDDVNQRHYVRVPGSNALVKRVQYRYSVFSTGGFSEDAQEYALAHQISLIDLRGDPWAALYPLLRTAAEAVSKIRPPRGVTVSASARRALRNALDGKDSMAVDASETTSPTGQNSKVSVWATGLADQVSRSVAGQMQLFLGFVDAPIILALRPKSVADFVNYVSTAGAQVAVNIRFSARTPLSGDWVITPKGLPDAFELRFPVPNVMVDVIANQDEWNERRLALAAKDHYLSTITVFVNSVPIRLNYRRDEVRR